MRIKKISVSFDEFKKPDYSNKPNKILFHYCNVETFMKIIENKTLRLSTLLHTNDSYEMSWAIKKIKEYISQSSNNFYPEELLHDEYCYNAYATCFSENGDLLSQWRGYADDGKGVSLGFDFSNFRDELESLNIEQSFGIRKVIYNENIQKDLIINEIKRQISLGESRRNINSIYAKYSGIFKNPGFSEEKEWRLMYQPSLIRNIENIFKDVIGNKLKHKYYNKNKGII